ncbi:hypothetical protein, partial [Pectinatus frisingensis]|uniref:hypothetical protein n=1 Tax=Pectinatus frisingensis TaxID=865 RepID=UPI0018C67083
GSFYVTALGGAQWYGDGTSYPNTVKWNYTSRIQKVTTGLAVTDLVRPANSIETAATYNNDKFDIRSLAILEDGTAYILTGSYYTVSTYNYRLNGRFWKTTIAALNSAVNVRIATIANQVPGTALSEISGFMWALLPADELNKAWGMLGNMLGVYDANGISGSAIDAATATGWSASQNPAFNAISLAMPSVVRRGTRTIKSVRGFVHPLLVSHTGMKPEDFEEFVNAHRE